jgi:hypothetical protein
MSTLLLDVILKAGVADPFSLFSNPDPVFTKKKLGS